MQLQQKQETSKAGVSGWCCCRREAVGRASQEAEAEQLQLGGVWEQCTPERGNFEKT